MSALKRSRASALLDRRVRPRKEEDSDVDENLSGDSDSSTPSEDRAGKSGASEDEAADDDSENVRQAAHAYHTVTDQLAGVRRRIRRRGRAEG